MDLTNIDTIKQILKEHGVRPDKKLGQNFLVSRPVLDEMVGSARLEPGDCVLEVGPGIGCLTLELGSRVKAVFACEKDGLMTKILSRTVGADKKIRIYKGDVRSREFKREFFSWLSKKSPQQKYKIVANIPYNITSFFIRDFLTQAIHPESMVLMVQKEVAERMAAVPGQTSLLSLSVQSYCAPEIVRIVSKNNFLPVPRVNSAIVRLDLRSGFLRSHPDVNACDFFRVMKIGFSSKRKTLYNNLSNGLHLPKDKIKDFLDKAGLSQISRAQELSLEDWRRLAEAVPGNN